MNDGWRAPREPCNAPGRLLVCDVCVDYTNRRNGGSNQHAGVAAPAGRGAGGRTGPTGVQLLSGQL